LQDSITPVPPRVLVLTYSHTSSSCFPPSLHPSTKPPPPSSSFVVPPPTSFHHRRPFSTTSLLPRHHHLLLIMSPLAASHSIQQLGRQRLGPAASSTSENRAAGASPH
ncbi:hypothetical protein PIB30_047832, partial [Stylosanthes scabra]|nr:hypothetical protein [Stylosanthes scabra]